MSNQNGSGPKTANGKIRSSRNSRRHGLFAAEFSFSAADEVQFRKLNSDFHEALKPNDAVLDFHCQDVAACAWRLLLARRYEQQELSKQFAVENEELPKELQAVGSSFPYRLKAQQAIKFLDDLEAAVQRSGSLPPELEEPFTQAFGADLWKTLTEWKPLDPVTATMARLVAVAAERSKIFGTELPDTNVSPEEMKKCFKAYAFEQQNVIGKLIAVYKNVFITMLSHLERGGGMLADERLSRLDLAIRYQTTARRDFYRALREYREAKNPR